MTCDEPLILNAGPLSVVMYRGDVRYLRINGTELVRRIYFSMRDSAWGTASTVIKNFVCDQQTDGFAVRYRASAEGVAGQFAYETTIRAKATAADVSLSVEIEGSPLTRVITNRTGISVLHPIEGLAGQACQVETPNGTKIGSTFPALISPDCLFSRIQAMFYKLGELSVTVRFYGELFEAEDQRNWADTSFKTYSRPLGEPRPYVLESGQSFRQAVSVVVKASSTEKELLESTPHLTLLPARRPLPSIGLRVSPGRPNGQTLSSLNADHYRIDAGGDFPDWRSDLKAVALSQAAIELAVHVGDSRDVNDLAVAVGDDRRKLHRVLVYQHGRPLPDPELVRAATVAFAGIAVGPGTVGNFAEVNRHRKEATAGRVTAYAANPQVHAMDDLSIMENLPSLGDAVRTFRSFSRDCAVAVGPITLHRVPDPFSAGSDGRIVQVKPDARQDSQLAAAWTVGVIKYLAECGAESLTLYETDGPAGLLAADGSPWPVFHVMVAVCEFAGGEVIPVSDPAPLHVIGLALVKNDQLRLIVANTRWHGVSVTVERIGPITLSAYEVRIIDLPANGAFIS